MNSKLVAVAAAGFLVSVGVASAANNIIPRTIAMELFTASWCGYCPAADAAMEQIAEEEGSAGAVVIEYHVNDALSTGDGNVRDTYYGVTGTPTMFFDGVSKIVGAGGNMYSAYRQRFDGRRDYDPAIEIKLDGQMGANSWTVSGRLEVVEQIWQRGNPVARIFLTEDNLRAGNRDYNHVLRKTIAQIPLSGKKVGDVTTFSQSVDISGAWKLDDLNAVVVVQEDQFSEILGAKQLPEVVVSVQEDSYTVQRGSSLDFDIQLKNITTKSQSNRMWFKAFRNGNQVGPDPIFARQVTTQAGQTQDLSLSYGVGSGVRAGTYEVAVWLGPNADEPTEWDTFTVIVQ